MMAPAYGAVPDEASFGGTPNPVLTIPGARPIQRRALSATENDRMTGETGQLQQLTDEQVSARLAAYNMGGSLERDIQLLRETAADILAEEVLHQRRDAELCGDRGARRLADARRRCNARARRERRRCRKAAPAPRRHRRPAGRSRRRRRLRHDADRGGEALPGRATACPRPARSARRRSRRSTCRSASGIRQLAASLDRLHGMGFTFGQRYVVVNIPAAVAEAVEDGKVTRRYVDGGRQGRPAVADADHAASPRSISIRPGRCRCRS